MGECELNIISAALSVASVLLGCIGIALVLAGIYSFFHFKNIAKREASETASRLVPTITEKLVRKYLVEEFIARRSDKEIKNQEALDVSGLSQGESKGEDK